MKYIKSYAIFEKLHEVDIVDELKNNFCEFYYYKNNGSKRHAYGTLRRDFLKRVWRPSSRKKGNRAWTERYIAYWDLEKKGFRMLKRDAFINLEDKEDSLKYFLKNHPQLKMNVKKAKARLKKKLKKEKLKALYMIEGWAKDNGHQTILDLIARKIAHKEAKIKELESQTA